MSPLIGGGTELRRWNYECDAIDGRSMLSLIIEKAVSSKSLNNESSVLVSNVIESLYCFQSFLMGVKISVDAKRYFAS